MTVLPIIAGTASDRVTNGHILERQQKKCCDIFAISLLWDSLGTHEVCVTETNQEGCSGDPVCVSVFVEDDVWNIFEASQEASLHVFPNPASGMLTIVVPSKDSQEEFVIYNTRFRDSLRQSVIIDYQSQRV